MWKKILQKGKKTTKYAIELIEKVMDSEPRTLNEILDLMYDEIENKRKANKSIRMPVSHLPTRSELRSYLGKNYNSSLFDKYNNRQLSTDNVTPNRERRYWK